MTKKAATKVNRSKSFAKAFKRDIGREKEVVEEPWEVQPGKSLLMNPTRQMIFKYLCEYPCSTLSTIAHDIQLTPPSTSWHLKLLSERKLIVESKLGGQKVYYPQEMIDQKVIPLLSLLANPKIKDIFVNVLESPGIRQKELIELLNLSHQSVNTFSQRLANEDLISVLRDGKFTRYYPTKKLNELENAQRKKLKEFRKWVIKAFKFDGVNPKLIRVTDRQLFLQITSGKDIKSFKLSVNPFITIIQDKSRFLSELQNKAQNQ
jgi:DNA-binding MarR family transcriptional regulator